MTQSGTVRAGSMPRLRRQSVGRGVPLSAWALFVLYGLLLLWVWLAIDAFASGTGPNGSSFGVDFSHTYAAVHVLSMGHNPYDAYSLSNAQHHLLSAYGVPVQPPSDAVLVGTSAFFLWLLQPIQLFPFPLVAVAWMLATYAFVGLTFMALLRHLGWRRRGLPTAIFLATPAVVLATYYGNMISLTFIAIAGGIPLLRRYPFLAGVVLSVSMLKLQVALPIVALIILFQAPHKVRVIAGFLSAFLARHVIALVLLGPAYQLWWLRSFLDFSRSIDIQPNLISLTGLYSASFPHIAAVATEVTSIALAGTITLAFWWRTRSRLTVSLEETGWLWFVWVLATPYAHFVDEMVLVIPVIAFVGVDGRRLARPVSVVVLYLLGLSILLFSITPMNVQLLSVPLMLCAGCFRLAATRNWLEESGAEAADRSDQDIAVVMRRLPATAR